MRARVEAITERQSDRAAPVWPREVRLQLGLCLLLLSIALVFWNTTRDDTSGVNPRVASEHRLDARMQHAANSSLDGREGAVIVMDMQSGRIRAVVNPELAFNSSFAPGSTIKPFTALAAMRSGLISPASRNVCREHYSHGDLALTCSHPRNLAPFDPTEAIAYSCNYYFGRVGEGLTEQSFNSTLTEFGFGRPTGIGVAGESSGKLPARGDQVANGLGETPYFRVTPIQLLTAYAALLNGGRLFRPALTAAGKAAPAEQHARLLITEEQRGSIIQGLRGTVRYGTAERARLHSLPLYVLGKTGTSTADDGYRTQGWFVGFASNARSSSPTAAENIELAVLVFLKRAQGADAAERARAVFEAFVGAEEGEMGGRGDGETWRSWFAFLSPHHYLTTSSDPPFTPSLIHHIPPSPRPSVPTSPTLRVALSLGGAPILVPLEEYVLGVVGTEVSTDTELESLKAQAVASRTFALRNMDRHAEAGYDFCSTTHCQRYQPGAALKSDSRRLATLLKVVKETEGQVLVDSRDQLVQSYFSASCGGATANIQTLWGERPASYLNGVVDDFCTTTPRRHWTDLISSARLLKALAGDPRTNVGRRLDSVTVTRNDQSGRAEWVTIQGEQRRRVRGWDFKIVVGRALGWNLLKSSRFTISRSGDDYVFRGNGFGHGLGLCQEGAHVMARRGATYRQILSKYFPGTKIKAEAEFSSSERDAARVKPVASFVRHTFTQAHHANAARRVSSENFRINYPKSVPVREVERLLELLEGNRKDLLRRLTPAGMPISMSGIELTINETTGDFVGRTGQPWWSAAATRGNRIELQPISVLRQRRILETTLRHELVHTVVDLLGNGRTPRWLSEGLAIHFAGEARMLRPYRPRKELSPAELEEKLAQPQSAADMRSAYAAAHDAVSRLIRNEGETNVWRKIKNAEPL